MACISNISHKLIYFNVQHKYAFCNLFSNYLLVRYKLVHSRCSIAPIFFLSPTLGRSQFGLSGFDLNVSQLLSSFLLMPLNNLLSFLTQQSSSPVYLFLDPPHFPSSVYYSSVSFATNLTCSHAGFEIFPKTE